MHGGGARCQQQQQQAQQAAMMEQGAGAGKDIAGALQLLQGGAGASAA